jgi:hypothetical protein
MRCAYEVIGKHSGITVVVMNQMAARDDQPAPTLRSAEVQTVLDQLTEAPRSPRLHFRPAPAIKVVDAPPAWPSLEELTGKGSVLERAGESLVSAVAREIVTSLLDAAFSAARGRMGWS